MKFLLFVGMLILGAAAVPQIIFLFFLQTDKLEFPAGAATEIVIQFIALIVVIFGFIGISSWIRKQEDVFY